jgi:hypothetical protein
MGKNGAGAELTVHSIATLGWQLWRSCNAPNACKLVMFHTYIITYHTSYVGTYLGPTGYLAVRAQSSELSLHLLSFGRPCISWHITRSNIATALERAIGKITSRAPQLRASCCGVICRLWSRTQHASQSSQPDRLIDTAVVPLGR